MTSGLGVGGAGVLVGSGEGRGKALVGGLQLHGRRLRPAQEKHGCAQQNKCSDKPKQVRRQMKLGLSFWYRCRGGHKVTSGSGSLRSIHGGGQKRLIKLRTVASGTAIGKLL